MLIPNLLLFCIALALLIISGSWLVKSGIKIANFLRLPEFLLGFVLIAVATSLPEWFVGIAAALSKEPELSLGTVLGSNIANICLIFGVGLLLAKRIRFTTKEAKTDSIVMLITAILPLALMMLGRQLSRIDGAVLLFVFFAYYTYVIRQRKRYHKRSHEQVSRAAAILSSFIFIASMVMLFFSARWTVKSGTVLATELQLPPLLIGLFFVAIGTSLPELVVTIHAMLRHETDIGIGNIIGSNITNVALVLGTTALLAPIPIDSLVFVSSALYVIVVSLVFTAFLESGRLTWLSGLSLIMLYIFFLFLEVVIKAIPI